MNGIDQRGASRRQQTGEKRDCAQDYADHEHGSQIGRADTEEKALQQTRACKHADQTEDETGSDETHSLADNEAKNVVTLSTERETNADFLSALRDRLAHHAKDSGSGQKQRNQREQTNQHRVQSRLGDRLRKIFGQCANAKNRNVLVDFIDCAAESVHERR